MSRIPCQSGAVSRSLVLVLALATALGLWFYQPWAPGRKQVFGAEAAAAGPLPISNEATPHRVEKIFQDLDSPWDLAFLDRDTALITLKPGRVLRVALDGSHRQEISGVPGVVYRRQGGLFSVILHPQFDRTGWLYLSYAVELADGNYSTRLTRFRLDGDQLIEPEILFTAEGASRKLHHFGGAMHFLSDGTLMLAIGDRGARDRAQDLDVHNGKLVRVGDDGSIPTDNPFVNRPGALAEIWSYGHRNPQGMDIDAAGALWVVEHGPRGGDEINRVEAGKNYGWPVITYGKEYIGGRIGEGTHKKGMEQPLHYYVPSIAVAGLSVYESGPLADWNQSLLVAALRGHLNRVQLDKGRAVSEHRLLNELQERVRAVRQGLDGHLYVLTENGSLLRVRPL